MGVEELHELFQLVRVSIQSCPVQQRLTQEFNFY